MPATTRPYSRRFGRPWIIGLVVLIAAAIVAVTVALRSQDQAPSTTDDQFGLAHVHGLGINPKDGSLHIATHYGTFRMSRDGGTPERVGPSLQDTMGFTVIGPDHFLGSGHPDLDGRRSGLPTQLGLIESTDGGHSWRNLSLSGAADFHALVVDGRHVYGWDSSSSRFMVTPDRREWEVRSSILLNGFVAGGEPARVVAATAGGVRVSTDGGRDWTAPTGPVLRAVTGSPTASIWGAGVDGKIYRSDDGGSSWTVVGSAGSEPHALLAIAGELWLATQDPELRARLLRSRDGGRTWELRFQEPGR